MSRSQTPTKHIIGTQKAEITLTVEQPVHWYTAWLLGYRAKAWPKDDSDYDSDRFNLVEKENE